MLEQTLHVDTNAFVHRTNLISSVKQECNSIVAWACFATLKPRQIAIIDGTMKYDFNQQILKENISTSLCELNLE